MSEPKITAAMDAMAIKRYKVHLLLQGVKSFTIYAKDPQEAVKLVMAGNGREAGSEGPKAVGAQVEEMNFAEKVEKEEEKKLIEGD